MAWHFPTGDVAMAENDLFYHAKRHQREIELAERAASPEASSAHRLLAEIYSVEVQRLARQPESRAVRRVQDGDRRERA